MAGVAGVGFKNCLAFRGERVGQRDIGCGERRGGQLRLEWLARVLVFVGALLGQLLSDPGIVAVQILAAETQPNQRKQQERVSSHRCRPFPGAAFEAAIEKRQRQHRESDQRRDHQHTDDRRRSVPIFQPLKDGQVIPFGTRDVLRIGGIGGRAELDGHKEAQQSEPDNEQRGERQVHQHLARIEEFGLLLRMVGIFGGGSGGPGLAKKKNVGCDEREDARRHQKHVGHEKAGDGECAHLGAAAHHALDAFTDQRDFADRVRADGRREISALVPGEQVAGESHGQDQAEQDASGKPKKFAAAFVGSV